MIKLGSKKWKTVSIPQTVINNNYENLVSIEEITDYDNVQNEVSRIKQKKKASINKKSTKKSNNQLEKKINLKQESHKYAKKRKLSNIVDNLQESNETNSVNDGIQLQRLQNMEKWSPYNIPESILKTLAAKGFKSPTEIQALCLPDAMIKKKDIFGAAETGSGKTLAFGIPIISGILKDLNIDTENNDEYEIIEKKRNNKLWALIVAPTRELVIQVKNHLQDLCKYIDIQVLDIIGGLSIEKQNRKLLKCPHIVVGTPGRLWQLICAGNEFLSSQVNSIRYLVIDEADRMMERLHFSELQCLLERLNSNKTKYRRTFIFSATLTLVHDPPRYITKKSKKKRPARITPGDKLQSFITLVGANNPSIIDITKQNVVASGVEELCIQCTMNEKDLYLLYILKVHSGRKIVFCNGITSVRRLANLLNILDVNPLPLFANMAQKQRLKNLERFQRDENRVLLATDVAARGLDISQVQYVIHYHVPKTSEIYVHRSGRTARGINEGISILLCCPSEMHHYNKIRQTLEKGEFASYKIDSPHVFNAVKKQVILARSILDFKTKVKKINDNSSWIEKCAKEMDLLLDDDEMPEKLDNKEQKQYKQQLKNMCKNLKNLMSQPILPYYISPRYPIFNSNKIL